MGVMPYNVFNMTDFVFNVNLITIDPIVSHSLIIKNVFYRE